MSNDRDDFLPAIRNTGLWASDSRKIANGKSLDVYLERTGALEPADLSDVEAVQWGHKLQDVIGRECGAKLRTNFLAADYSLTHSKETYIKSHFDFIDETGRHLLEVKNYNAAVRNKFGEDGSDHIPVADFAQCVHEALVHNLDQVTLGVLFGGQELCCYPITVTEAHKEEMVQVLAKLWGRIVAKNPPDATTIEQTKLLYPTSTDGVVTADQNLENDIEWLKMAKANLKTAETDFEEIELRVRKLMGTNSELRTFDGRTLVTWKSAKASEKFDTALFKSAMPDIYDKFIVSVPGSRRFLLK